MFRMVPLPVPGRNKLLGLLPLGDLVHGAAGLDRGQIFLGEARRASGLLLFDLAEQPVLGALPLAGFEADQNPLPLHPLAVEREMVMTLLQRLQIGTAPV